MSRFLDPDDIERLTLSQAELAHLTDTKVAALQIAWLDENRWIYTLSRRGRPKVARAYFDLRMGVIAANDEDGQTQPDWSHG